MRMNVFIFRMKSIHRCSLTLYVEILFKGRKWKLPQKRTNCETLVLTWWYSRQLLLSDVAYLSLTFFEIKMKNNCFGFNRCSYTRLENSTDKTTVKTRWIHGHLKHSFSLSHTHTHTQKSVHPPKHSYACEPV